MEQGERIRSFFQSLPACAPVRCYTRLPIIKKDYQSNLRYFSITVLAFFEKIFISLSHSVLPRWFTSIPVDAPIVVKSVESFGRIPLFLKSVQNLKIIYIIRHPCGVRYSLIRGERMGKFKDNISITESIPRLTQLVALKGARRRGLSLSLLLSKSPPERFGYWWLLTNEKAVEECKKTSCAKIVVYEELCRDTLRVMAEVYGFLGWELTDKIKFHMASMIGKNDPKYYSVFKDPRKTMDAWKHGLDPEESSKIQEILASSPLRLFWEETMS